MSTKPAVLALVHHYIPGYKSGGPARTIANLVEYLGDEFDIRVLTADRDLGDSQPYADVAVDRWSTVGKAQVFYASRRNQTFFRLASLIRTTPHDVVYLNSFYNPIFTIQPLLALRAGLLGRKPTIIAPRGEFSGGAAAIKSWKKVPYRWLAFTAGLYDDLIWQASSKHEAADIRRSARMSKPVTLVVADPPSPRQRVATDELSPHHTLRAIFLSRISPMKNLDYALRVLSQVKEPLEFDIYGPIGDDGYWRRCQDLIASMPGHVTVTYMGAVDHTEVTRVLSGYDALFLPTRGENFGHVIAESLGAGTPVLISDATPWRDLEAKGVGWDVPLGTPQVFVDILTNLAKMSTDEKLCVRKHVRTWAARRLNDPTVIEANRQMFLFAIGRTCDLQERQDEGSCG